MMNTRTIKIDIPSDILLALNESEDEFGKNIKIAMAVRLYRAEKLTIGKAAQLAGMDRLAFESMLSEFEIPVSNLNLDDIKADIEKLK